MACMRTWAAPNIPDSMSVHTKLSYLLRMVRDVQKSDVRRLKTTFLGLSGPLGRQELSRFLQLEVAAHHAVPLPWPGSEPACSSAGGR